MTSEITLNCSRTILLPTCILKQILVNINNIKRFIQLLYFSVLFGVQMKTQIICPFALEIAQVTSKCGFLAAFVLQMSTDVALEFVALETSDATVYAVVFNVIRFCICNNTFEYLIR